MEKGTHGQDEETFENLDYAGQAKSINGQMRVLEKAIRAHVRKADAEGKNSISTRDTFLESLERMIYRIRTS